MIDGMFAQLAGPQRSAQGFILHANGPVAGTANAVPCVGNLQHSIPVVR
jgi:hypothetical protein